jgi:hypothetical protein
MSAVREVELHVAYLERQAEKGPEGHKWKGPLPKGWTDESRKKFWDSLTSAAPKHKVTQCIKRMEGKVENPGAFCASLADRVIPGWRAEAAKERKKKAFSELRAAAAILKQPLRTRRDYGAPYEDKEHSRMPGDDLPEVDRSEIDRRASDAWISREEMSTLCPPCAERMQRAGFKRVRASVMRRMLERDATRDR